MCETNAFLRHDGKEEMFVESVARIEVKGDMLEITGVFGDRMHLKGRITEINFQGGKVFLERL